MAKFNNNNSKGNNNKGKGGNKSGGNNRKRQPMKFTNYTKTFYSFDEAINNMIANNDVVADVLLYDGAATMSTADIYNRLCDVAKSHVPNPETRENIHWEFHISANKISVKTDQFVAFGWNIRSRKVQDQYEVTVDSRITIFGENPLAKKTLEDDGWVVEEKKNVRH